MFYVSFYQICGRFRWWSQGFMKQTSSRHHVTATTSARFEDRISAQFVWNVGVPAALLLFFSTDLIFVFCVRLHMKQEWKKNIHASTCSASSAMNRFNFFFKIHFWALKHVKLQCQSLDWAQVFLINNRNMRGWKKSSNWPECNRNLNTAKNQRCFDVGR